MDWSDPQDQYQSDIGQTFQDQSLKRKKPIAYNLPDPIPKCQTLYNSPSTATLLSQQQKPEAAGGEKKKNRIDVGIGRYFKFGYRY